MLPNMPVPPPPTNKAPMPEDALTQNSVQPQGGEQNGMKIIFILFDKISAILERSGLTLEDAIKAWREQRGT